ncbi:MAG: DNA-binding transcriptional regulator, ArsR family [Cryobacterium sp.]|nr:DNA-binding transcriptional regulator, ArsR family [Cryobacterium sp.]
MRTRTDGRVRTCTIEPNALRTAEDWIAERRTSRETKRDPVGALLHKS